ncbi:glucuronosyltransferase [Novosphingobium album (ex Liu et al. 2023)]|uniref:Glucuronosyltransferase n=1 Tax=Novosphingobium album (ex Liu et al. 2023) TaxID=3031130 RepID=A0ABT5WQI4_9SPHN|nr:glucuronosyltransferase [Novosphingobium album (ex Liu et al. 2023)]MDE8652299.1 glucuronosyltransferase [Novosphingobium album (ex Liu et al. 2023)]
MSETPLPNSIAEIAAYASNMHGYVKRRFIKREVCLGKSEHLPRARLMAVASGGGHWEELMLLRPAIDEYEPLFVTTIEGLAKRDHIARVQLLPDSNRDQPLAALRCLIAAFWLIRAHRPQVLVTTGALPGLFCLFWARLFGARTIWVDSIANFDGPSLSGRFAKPFANLWLTQWEHLADGKSIQFGGAVL